MIYDIENAQVMLIILRGAARPRCRFTKESTNGENLHISFSKITRFRLLMKIRAFQCKLEMSAHPVLLQYQL